MFGKKKLYEIVWSDMTPNPTTTIIAARNDAAALRKFYYEYGHWVPSIISFKEYKIG
jgi:hypothetical protein